MSSAFVFKPTKKFIFNPRPKEDRPLKSYHIEKLAPVQKNFNTIKPVRPFNRFGLPKISNTNKIAKFYPTITKTLLQIISVFIKLAGKFNKSVLENYFIVQYHFSNLLRSFHPQFFPFFQVYYRN